MPDNWITPFSFFIITLQGKVPGIVPGIVPPSESLDFGLTFGGRYIMSEHFSLKYFLTPPSMLELVLFDMIR